MTVGQRIQARRQQLNLSVDDLAERIGKNRATVYRYESEGIKNLPVAVLEDIARALRTTPGALLAQEENVQSFNQEEENLIDIFRSLDFYGKDMVMTVAKKEQERCKEQDA